MNKVCRFLPSGYGPPSWALVALCCLALTGPATAAEVPESPGVAPVPAYRLDRTAKACRECTAGAMNIVDAQQRLIWSFKGNEQALILEHFFTADNRFLVTSTTRGEGVLRVYDVRDKRLRKQWRPWPAGSWGIGLKATSNRSFLVAQTPMAVTGEKSAIWHYRLRDDGQPEVIRQFRNLDVGNVYWVGPHPNESLMQVGGFGKLEVVNEAGENMGGFRTAIDMANFDAPRNLLEAVGSGGDSHWLAVMKVNSPRAGCTGPVYVLRQRTDGKVTVRWLFNEECRHSLGSTRISTSPAGIQVSTPEGSSRFALTSSDEIELAGDYQVGAMLQLSPEDLVQAVRLSAQNARPPGR